MPDLPSGTVTFLFTDIEGSTALWEQDQVAMASAVARHLTILRATTEAHNGLLFKVVGDAVQAAFPTAPAAIAAAVDAQRALLAEEWGGIEPLRVRMALHAGEAMMHEGEYRGPLLNRSARLLGIGHGSQILLSETVAKLARDGLPPKTDLRELGEHRLPDLLEPECLFQLLHPDLPADFPPIRTLATRSHNLPVQPTPFLGREEQVAQVVDLLRRKDVRLLTITGPGGVGKTRLALQAAADLLETFPEGVWLVDLSVLGDPTLVPSAIAGVLGVREAESGLADRLGSVLSGKRLLLVLDNFERVVDAAQSVSDLLARAQGLKVLVTSRTPLHIYAEREYPLSPLLVPDPMDLPSVERLSQYEAVRLFVERARAVKPDFAVTSANAAAVVEICHRLDGLPLAIELAAALVRLLSAEALLHRLKKRLPLLTRGARDVPARQQTMRNAIAWSHDLLTQEERIHFRRLAVFPGGCTLEAAEAVVNQEGNRDVFSGLAALVDKSLLREAGAEGEPRYQMLETVREFGLERLAASGEEAATRDRHAEFCRDLLEHRDLKDFDRAWLDCIAREHDNLRAALGWSWESGKHDTLIRLAGALLWFWYYRGYLNEGQHWLSQALETPADVGAPQPRAWALTAGGLLANVLGDTDRAAELLTASFDWWEQTGDTYGYMLARSLLGGVRVNQGRYNEAAALFAANETSLCDAGDESWLGHARFHLGVIAWVQGDDARARSLLREAVEHFDRSRAPANAIDPLRYLGLLACAAGDLDEATAWFREELTRLRQEGNRAAIAVGLADVATLAAACEAWQPVVRLFAKAEALLLAEAAAFSLPARDRYQRAHTRAREALGDAASQAAAVAGRALTLDQALEEAEAVLAVNRDGGPGATPAPSAPPVRR